MSLEKMKRVSQLWNWLPTFRAAGETQQLSLASTDLGVSTSAVSRAVRLLEDDLGHALFDRVGRNVRLNEAGREMLHAVRNAMRVIDEAIVAVEGNQFSGQVRIACDEPLTTLFVLPVLPELGATHPRIVPHLCRAGNTDLASALCKGDIDVALTPHEVFGPGIEVQNLGSVSLADYVGPRHPLYEQTQVSDQDLQRFPRAELARDGQTSLSAFPPNAQVRLLVEDLSVLMAATRDGGYVARLPDTLVAISNLPLRRLAPRTPHRLDVFIARRERLEVPTRADKVVDAILGHLAQRKVAE